MNLFKKIPKEYFPGRSCNTCLWRFFKVHFNEDPLNKNNKKLKNNTTMQVKLLSLEKPSPYKVLFLNLCLKVQILEKINNDAQQFDMYR